jgi:hypothetical protein
MKKYLVLALLFLCAVSSHATVRTLQVTLGSGVTQVLSAGSHFQVRWFVIQDNATHSVRIGDAQITSSRGLALTPSGGSFYVGPDQGASSRDLGTWYIIGTNGDVVDVIYDDGQI